ncbi:hypothetical protein PIB30_018324 [Stylosanthes scabra]|uniref:Uncharacterized protein n=1 Tax=Stylosanthes scabra TaxID=79078 RepID=A0ABU6Z7E0_9FABA|nr:hypothetical protein [Stylosanthes scabra]
MDFNQPSLVLFYLRSLKESRDGVIENTNPNIDEEIDEGGAGEVTEAIKTKQICEIGGFTFNNSEEADVLAKIAGGKTPKKILSYGIVGVPQNDVRKENLHATSVISEGSDDIPLAKLIKKTPKKQKPNTPVKKGKLTKSVQKLGGRNLSAKILRLGSKPKL